MFCLVSQIQLACMLTVYESYSADVKTTNKQAGEFISMTFRRRRRVDERFVNENLPQQKL